MCFFNLNTILKAFSYAAFQIFTNVLSFNILLIVRFTLFLKGMLMKAPIMYKNKRDVV